MAWTLPLSLPVLPSLEWLETHSERLICEVQFRSTNHQHQSKMLFPFKTSAVADKSPISSLHFDRLSALTSDLIYFPNAGFKVKRLFVISIWSVSLRIDKSNKPKITVACNTQLKKKNFDQHLHHPDKPFSFQSDTCVFQRDCFQSGYLGLLQRSLGVFSSPTKYCGLCDIYVKYSELLFLNRTYSLFSH